MKNIKSRNFKRSPIALAVALTLTVPMSINQVQAGAGWGDHANMVSKVPTYYANSPSGLHSATSCFTTTPGASQPTVATPVLGGACDSGTALRKFVNNLPLPEVSGLANTHPVGVAGDLGAGYIPIARAEKWVNAQGLTTNDDYYEIAAIEYAEQKHSDLPATKTRLRMYVQLETAGNAATSKHIALTYPDGTPILNAASAQVFAYDTPHSLGPIINATKGSATRIKFTNYLPFGVMKGAKHFLPVDTTMQSAGVGPDGITPYTENRISVHLHGGDGPWVSAGSAHQWFVPAGETAAYAAGMGKGASAANVPDMPDPGPGSYTLYYPNIQNGRFMWYHDQASGIIRLNVYAGMAAGYTLTDQTEKAMVTNGVLPGTIPTGGTVPVADDIPLMIQDVSFVPKDIATQDAYWNVDANTNLPVTTWGQYGDLWFPHVYEINQDPNSPSGWTPVGRWDWGPWFWPVFPAQYSVPSGLVNDVTWVPNAYMDTMMVNGVVYPTLTVEPKPYRMRFMNISNDRFINLGFYLADTTSATAVAAAAATGVLGTDPVMVPFTDGLKRADGSAIVFPGTWGQVTSTMSHPAGVPDPQMLGPDIIQIGNEGGLLPQAIVLPSTITNFEWNRRSVSVSNIMEHGVLLGGGEVSDTVVDFSGFAGKTLILYNDAPNMVPAGEPRVDYYTGDPDQTGQGGAEKTKAGYGPNTRTVMRVVVSAAVTTGTSTWPATGTGLDNLIAKLPAAYAASGQQPPVVTALAYNQAFGTTNIDNYLKIGSGSSKQPDLIMAPPGPVTISSLSIADSGGWYTSMPTVKFTPPGGATGSGATAVVGGSLGGITVIDVNKSTTDPVVNPSTGANPGVGYTSTPTVVFSGGTYPDGTTINWAAGQPLPFGPLPTATAVVAPAVFALPNVKNIGKAAITIPGLAAVPVGIAPVYQAVPPAPVTITFTSPTSLTVTGAAAPADNGVKAYVSGGLIRINGYDVAITGAGALAPAKNDVFTITANREAGTIVDVVLATMTTPNVAAFVPGTFKTMPTVTLVGGGATVPAVAKALPSGRLNSITLQTAGSYSAIPLVEFIGGGGVGATAQVHVANPITYPIRNKGIQELYEFTYGRLNGGFSVELPFTTVAIQTTVPVAYIDPVSETLNDGEVQIWKITHNGLFTHPVYFNHLDVQLINRVGWDGTIKPPYPDELGWKDTIRCNQLEDVYVAVRPKAQPNAGFGMPESNRLWDPAQPDQGIGSGMGFTGASLVGSPVASDPNYNAAFGTVAPAPANTSTPCSNVVSDYLPTAAGGTGAVTNTCLDNEFSWIDGMLGWAELDFMRPIAFHPFVMDVRTGSPTYGRWITALSNIPAVAPALPAPGVLAAPQAPTLLSVTSGASGNTLTWADNSPTEYRFDILRSTTGLAGSFTPLVVPALANATTYVDTTAQPATPYWYQVTAVGAKTDAIRTSTSASVAVTAPVALPATPAITSITPGLNSGGTSLVLHWTAIPGATIIVYQNGVAVPAANLTFSPLVNPNSVTVSGLAAGSVAYQFALQSQVGALLSPISATVTGTTAAGVNTPAAPTATAVTATGLTLNWVDVGAQGNAGGAVSYDIYKNGVFMMNVPGAGLVGTAQSVVIGDSLPSALINPSLVTGGSYSFSIVAVSSAANAAVKVASAQSSLLNIMLSAGVTVDTALSTDTTLTVNWATVPGATDYWVYVNNQPWNYVGPGYTPGSGNLVVAGAARQSTQLTGLLPNTTYALTLMWGTAAGNSAQSIAVPATTLTAAPAMPTVVSTTSSVTLNWAAVVGATYTVYDNGTLVYTGTLPSVTLTAAPGSLHSYTLANTIGPVISGQSAPLAVLTPMLAPSVSAVTSTGLTLNWTAVAGATSYTIYQDGAAVATSAGTTLAITGLNPLTNHSFAVTATATSATLPAYTATSIKSVVQTVMSAPTVSAATATGMTLSWLPVAGATAYTVYQNGVALPGVAGASTTRVVTGLVAGTAYSYTVAAMTPTVPLSAQSAPVSITPPAPMAAPTATAVSLTGLTLNWVAPARTPNYFVIYKNGVEIARPAAGTTSFVVTGLAAATSYNFTMVYNLPYANSTLTTAISPALTVVTTTPPAIPVAPALPTATLITPNGLTLNWNAVAGATGYTVYQNGVALPAVAGTSVTRTGLTASTSYTFTVVATNAGGSSAQSPVLTVATTTVAATTPANTSVTMLPETRGALGTGSFTLNWSPVQGATSYVVYQNGVMLPLVAGVATSRSLTLVSGTSYNFRVAYRNSLNVLSAPSAIQTVKAP